MNTTRREFMGYTIFGLMPQVGFDPIVAIFPSSIQNDIRDCRNLDDFMGQWKVWTRFDYDWSESRIGSCKIKKDTPVKFGHFISPTIIEYGLIYGIVTIRQYRDYHGNFAFAFEDFGKARWIFKERVKLKFLQDEE